MARRSGAGRRWGAAHPSPPEPARSSTGRVPPHDLDAEAAVLSALLLEHDALDRVSSKLKADHFYSPANRRIYEACLALAEAGQPRDAVTVGGWLKSRERLAEVGGVPYLGQIVDAVPSVANLEHYARIVTRKWRVRQVIAEAQRIAAEGYGDVGEDEDKWCEAKALSMSETASAGTEALAVRLGDIVKARVGEIITARRLGQELGTTTGFPTLDDALGNVHEGQLGVVAAETGGGKSAFAMSSMLESAARTLELRVRVDGGEPRHAYPEVAASLLFSLEMMNAQVADRAIASRSGVPVALLQRARLSEQDVARIIPAVGEVSPLPVFVVDRAAVTLAEVRSEILRVQRECARITLPCGRRVVLRHVWLDYIQIMGAAEDAYYEGYTRSVADNARGLKEAAKDFRLTMWLLSQFKKRDTAPRSAGAKEGDGPPAGPTWNKRDMGEIRDSSEIQHAADLILLAYRDESPRVRRGHGRQPALVDVAKSRQGPKADLPFEYDGVRTRFYECPGGHGAW